TPGQLLEWTGGRAWVATGSPFDPVVWDGVERVIGQANNLFVFPGVGLGLIVSGTNQATWEMFLEAARVLADAVTPDRLATGALYPPLADLRRVSTAVALRVARLGSDPELSDGYLAQLLERQQWFPDYEPYVAVGAGDLPLRNRGPATTF
ncbi:MAG TPA: malic enzyme-like NAD(P)-binding protein, partial [Actinomycetota bacterium]|nr:malic enzyme-like NAD(P)-binding protein [Actinomycetota bacterium]